MPANILVIDDHQATLNLIKSILQKRGYQVRTASSGMDGLAFVANQIPDLILLDLNMPQMDGYEVLERLRQRPDMQQVPIILFTAQSQAAAKFKGFGLGADDFLVKPTNPHELLDRIEIQLKRVARASATGELLHPNQSSSLEDEPSASSPNLEEEQEEVAKSPPMSGVIPLSEITQSKNLIAVMGTRGGAGCTTTAINLAVTLANQGQATTLVDLDLVQGHIAFYLNQPTTNNINLLALLTSQDLEDQLPKQLTPLQENLSLLLAQSNFNNRLPFLNVSQTQELLSVLCQPRQNVVIDLGHHLTDYVQVVLEHANQIILCVCPDRVSLETTKLFVKQFKAFNLIDLVKIVVVDFRQRRSLPQSSIEKFIEHPLFMILQINDNKLAQAVNLTQPLVQALPNSDEAKQFKNLVQRLAQLSHSS